MSHAHVSDEIPVLPCTCPRCGSTFACGATADAPCAFAALTLDDAMRSHIAERWQGCLCVPCLLHLSDPCRGAEADLR